MRQADHPILPVILNRWSRRAMSGEAVSRTELMSLFEAARWAPSSYNSQPWRFVYALRGSPAWQVMYDALDALNKDWCVNAGALIIVLSRTRYELDNRPDPSFALNAGAAWEKPGTTGYLHGAAVRGMQDFDYDALSQAFSIPESLRGPDDDRGWGGRGGPRTCPSVWCHGRTRRHASPFPSWLSRTRSPGEGE